MNTPKLTPYALALIARATPKPKVTPVKPVRVVHKRLGPTFGNRAATSGESFRRIQAKTDPMGLG